MTRSATGGGSRWAAPTLALLMGALLVAVGGGVGLPHLAKVGLAPTTALGLVALLAGVVLAALTVVGLLRAARGWWLGFLDSALPPVQ